MDRNMLMNSIPKPSNGDVIVYDTTLKNLIDVDVFQEYKELLPIFTEKSKEFLVYMHNIENYKETLNNIYLYRADWSEEDYLFNLKNEKQTYSNLFQPIKKIENNIEILQKKLKMIDNKIELQKVKEDVLIIDLASNPGGIDKMAAKKLGIKLIWALSLPGKVAPITSAEFIKDTLYNMIKEM